MYIFQQRKGISWRRNTEKGIFLGYSTQSKGYRIYNLKTKKLIISRDVEFDEDAMWNWDEEKVERQSVMIPKETPPQQQHEEGTDQSEMERRSQQAPGSPRRPPPSEEIEEETPPRRTKLLSDIYETCNFIMFEPENFETAVKHKKHKARLVAKGYSQLQGIDYTETFAPVARLDTIRALIAIAANKKWKIYQMDVKSAFLNGYVDEEIYVEQPQGFIAKGSEEKVLRLKKALYGLKQAPKAWYSRIDKYFMDRGFRRSLSEPTLYIKSQGNDTLIVSLYVDDLIYTGNNEKMIQDFKEDMMKTFEMSDLGLMHFLGIEINQEKEGIFICQRKYTETLLKKFKMESCKTVSTPLVTGKKYQKEEGSQKVDGSMFRSLIGSLLYLTATKTRLCSPQVCYQDSDWAGSVDDMKSTSGYTFSLGSGIFSWASKKQATVAQSSAEAEYIAAAATSNQAIWLRRILEDIGEKQEEPTTIYCDNKSAIAITKNPVQHSRTKHIDIKYHSLREATTRGEIELKYCSTEEQLADIFTKALPRNKFEELRMKIGVCHKHIKGEY
ncbi:UNVERIFIED_CONTAM: Retrovirus-related Pol polyprotein from transposon RE2 [Sesamum angustifolium]|uniref:Retrovirus-related Pol polyprotein from transposon RE2 n=1 Tax=Sesamum angustifolium TaxID=2727405 RepID=A0AAW2LHT7_9LAMI